MSKGVSIGHGGAPSRAARRPLRTVRHRSDTAGHYPAEKDGSPHRKMPPRLFAMRFSSGPRRSVSKGEGSRGRGWRWVRRVLAGLALLGVLGCRGRLALGARPRSTVAQGASAAAGAQLGRNRRRLSDGAGRSVLRRRGRGPGRSGAGRGPRGRARSPACRPRAGALVSPIAAGSWSPPRAADDLGRHAHGRRRRTRQNVLRRSVAARFEYDPDRPDSSFTPGRRVARRRAARRSGRCRSRHAGPGSNRARSGVGAQRDAWHCGCDIGGACGPWVAWCRRAWARGRSRST